MSGRLVSTRRRVEAGARQDYAREWTAVRTAAEAAGARAWRFVSNSDGEEMLEFLEFRAGADPRRDGEVGLLLDALDQEYGGVTEEWEEVG